MASLTSTSGTMTINSTFSVADSTFTHNGGTITFNGSLSLTPGANTYDNVNFTGSYGFSMTLTGTLYIAGNFSSGTNSSITGGTVNFNGTTNQTLTGGAGANYITFVSPAIITNSGTSVILGSNIVFTNLTLTTLSNLNLASYTMVINGTFINNANPTFSSTGTIQFNGSNSITSGTSTYYNISFTGAYGFVKTLSGTFYIAGNFTSSNQSSITGGTVTFNGTGNQTITDGGDASHTTTFNSVTIFNNTGGAGTSIIFGNNATFTALTLTAVTNINLAGYTLGINGTYINNANPTISSTGTVAFGGSGAALTPGTTNYTNVSFPSVYSSTYTISGTLYVAGNLTGTNLIYITGGTIQLNGTSAQTINCNVVNYYLTISSTFVDNNTSATVTLMSNAPITTLTINSGATFNLNGYNLTSTTITNNGTFELQGSETVSSTPTNNSGSLVEFIATSGSTTLPNWTYSGLEINGIGGTFTLPAANLTLSTILNVNAGTLWFDSSHSLTVQDSGATGTAITIGTNGILLNKGTGSLVLYANVTNNGVVTFNSSVNNSGILIQSNNTTRRNWQGTGIFNFQNVEPSYQDCSGGSPALILAYTSTNGGNNNNWVFMSPATPAESSAFLTF